MSINNRKNLHAIILAAGLGRRLRPYTQHIPKCLIKVRGKIIIDTVLENLSRLGICHATIVVGYMADRIKNHIGGMFRDMKITYTENKDYACTGTAYSLYCGMKHINSFSNILIIEGDVIFEYNLISDFCKLNDSNMTIVEKYNENLDGSFVDIKDGYINDWIHASVRDKHFRKKEMYKTVNITKIDKAVAVGPLMAALQASVNSINRLDPLEYIFRKTILHDQIKIKAFDASVYKWVEIDDEADLQYAEKIFSSSA